MRWPCWGRFFQEEAEAEEARSGWSLDSMGQPSAGSCSDRRPFLQQLVEHVRGKRVT